MMIEKNANIHTQLFEMLKLGEFIYKTRETEVHNYSFVAMTLELITRQRTHYKNK